LLEDLRQINPEFIILTLLLKIVVNEAVLFDSATITAKSNQQKAFWFNRSPETISAYQPTLFSQVSAAPLKSEFSQSQKLQQLSTFPTPYLPQKIAQSSKP